MPFTDSPSELGPLVRSMFAGFQSKGLAWAMLRGYDELPDATRYDLDILVEPADLPAARRTVLDAADQHGWHLVGRIDKFRYQCLILAAPDVGRFLPIDLFAGCYHRFYPMADASIGLADRRRLREDVWYVPPGFGALVTVVKELMRHDTFKENSREAVQRGALEDPESFLVAGRRTLGPPLMERLLSVCQQGDWQRLESLAVEIRRQVWRQRWRQLPAAMAFGVKHVRHLMRPSMGRMVVLLGPDGAGKSTIADQLCQRLLQHPFKVCRHYEYNFRVLPELKQIRARLLRGLGRATPPPAAAPPPGQQGSGMNPEHSPLRGLMYVTYYTIDLMIGHAIVRRLRGQQGLIVFARYFQDYYYQRGYGRVPRWAMRLLERLIPRPDLILALDRDAAEIYAAKPELDLAEIERQQAVIRQLLAGRKNGVVLDASQGVQTTTDRAMQVILQTLVAPQGSNKQPTPCGQDPGG